MRTLPIRAIAFVLYQLSLLTGIALFPMAVAMQKLGVTLPVHRVVDRAGDVYDSAAAR
jgi:hypothetical protein